MTIHLERSAGTEDGPPGSRGIAWVPVSDTEVDSVLEGIRAKDAGAVKAALLEAIKRWYTPAPR